MRTTYPLKGRSRGGEKNLHEPQKCKRKKCRDIIRLFDFFLMAISQAIYQEKREEYDITKKK